MKDSARYVKIVEWSHEDRCYVGSSPGLIYGGCHGEDEKAVFDELCRSVEDAIELYRREGGHYPLRHRGETSLTRCRTSHDFRLGRDALTRRKPADELCPHYKRSDFGRLARGKYAQRVAEATCCRY